MTSGSSTSCIASGSSLSRNTSMPTLIRHRRIAAEPSSPPDLVLQPADDPAGYADRIGALGVIAVNFPKFGDGRGYSIARQLRERHGYKGELRAVGEVARDHLHAMAQCGFDAFELREGENAQEALKGFGDFSEQYQATAAQPVPLFRRRAG
ncbi:MAG: DUF934 domain-containing protein [Candidatus Parcubacteria bacterium]|nr:DUF934 domain-containing protein [Burkholderiales bacterium]